MNNICNRTKSKNWRSYSKKQNFHTVLCAFFNIKSEISHRVCVFALVLRTNFTTVCYLKLSGRFQTPWAFTISSYFIFASCIFIAHSLTLLLPSRPNENQSPLGSFFNKKCLKWEKIFFSSDAISLRVLKITLFQK